MSDFPVYSDFYFKAGIRIAFAIMPIAYISGYISGPYYAIFVGCFLFCFVCSIIRVAYLYYRHKEALIDPKKSEALSDLLGLPYSFIMIGIICKVMEAGQSNWETDIWIGIMFAIGLLVSNLNFWKTKRA